MYTESWVCIVKDLHYKPMYYYYSNPYSHTSFRVNEFYLDRLMNKIQVGARLTELRIDCDSLFLQFGATFDRQKESIFILWCPGCISGEDTDIFFVIRVIYIEGTKQDENYEQNRFNVLSVHAKNDRLPPTLFSLNVTNATRLKKKATATRKDINARHVHSCFFKFQHGFLPAIISMQTKYCF